ncbi:MAG: tRNA-dihydrouridine synthase family protein [Lentisphaerota bacterium]
MAGLTHSAFRRLLSDYGGYGALFTEMLSARQILKEDLASSPYTRRSEKEGKVIYQLMVQDTDRLDEVIGRLATLNPEGLDINLACHAPKIRNVRAGSRLFDDAPALLRVLSEVRRCWPGLLTVKIRLGWEREGWQKLFVQRLRVIEDAGVDAITLHPRFFEDKFKRRVRHEYMDWVVSKTRLPIIANGDLTGPESLKEFSPSMTKVSGFMFGRILMVKPWLFASMQREVAVEYFDVWGKLFEYISEDFPPDIAMERIKLFSIYYARNFQFGHSFANSIANSTSPQEIRDRAALFLKDTPNVLQHPSLQGL